MVRVNEKPRLRAAIYARVSTTDQDYAMQLTELQDYARRNDWETVEYAEKVSTRKRRPAHDRMMEDARLKKIDIVLVWKLDRFGRSNVDLHQQILRLEQYGVRFIALTQGIDTDKRNPMQKLILGVMACYAEFERDLINERVGAGKRRYIADYAAGRIGKERQSKSGKNLAPHRPKRIFRRDEAARLRQDGWSFRRIAAELRIPVSTVVDALRASQPKK
jgi:putative DNA-invertase from lambdoid prophage Rac